MSVMKRFAAGVLGVTLFATSSAAAPALASNAATVEIEFKAWKAAHRDVATQVAKLKLQTTALISQAGALPMTDEVDRYHELAERSRALAPEERERARQSFAEAVRFWQSQDFSAAKQRILEGLAIDPASGVGNFYLGDLLDREGDKAGAAAAMDRARLLVPDSAEGRKAALALPALPAIGAEQPDLDRPPVIWRVPGAIDEIWDAAEAPRLVVIPAGEYTMGSAATEAGREDHEAPRHRVRINYPLAVGKYPVTRGEFARFVAETSHPGGSRCQTFINGKFDFRVGSDWRNPGFQQEDDHPVVCVNWHDARAYTTWLSKKTGQTYRLLSEAEYEYVTRAGTTTAYWWGDDPGHACEFVNGADLDAKAQPPFDYWAVNECRDGHVYTTPVDRFKPNPFGLYGISGNSLSWLEDCWTDSYNVASNDGSSHFVADCYQPMVRGGSWSDKPGSLRAAQRGWNIHTVRFSMNGFRVARVL